MLDSWTEMKRSSISRLEFWEHSLSMIKLGNIGIYYYIHLSLPIFPYIGSFAHVELIFKENVAYFTEYLL